MRSFARLRMTFISCSLLLFVGVFRRKFDKNIFERRPDLMNLCMANAGAVQFFFYVRALDTFIDKQMHRLTKHGRAPHAAELMNSLKLRQWARAAKGAGMRAAPGTQ